MARQLAKRWRLPNTEIDIVRVENGSDAQASIWYRQRRSNLPEFYARVKYSAVRPGPGEQLDNTIRKLGHSRSATIYDAFLSSPFGFSFVVPPRWLLESPGRAKARVVGATAWQWSVGLAIGFLIGGLIIWLGHRGGRRVPAIAKMRQDRTGARSCFLWQSCSWPVSWCLSLAQSSDRRQLAVRIVTVTRGPAQCFLAPRGWPSPPLLSLASRLRALDARRPEPLDNQLIRLGTRLSAW